jgi:hypothetical protein
MRMIVLSPDEVFHVDRGTFESEARKQFGPGFIEPQDPYKDLTIRYDRPGESMFHIFHDRQGDTISTDGTPEQAAEVALWARSLVPDDPGGRIWLVDEMFNGHAELVPGMTVDELEAAWVDHGQHPPEFETGGPQRV